MIWLLVMIIISVCVTILLMLIAPEGYEDEDRFHYKEKGGQDG